MLLEIKGVSNLPFVLNSNNKTALVCAHIPIVYVASSHELVEHSIDLVLPPVELTFCSLI